MDEELCRAISERRLIAFSLDGYARVGEPHDFGVIGGETRLFFYQVGGASRSGRPLGWRWAVVARISELRLLEDRFRARGRPRPDATSAGTSSTPAFRAPRRRAPTLRDRDRELTSPRRGFV